MSARVTVVALGTAPLDEPALLALAGAEVVLGSAADLARVAHLLPPVVGRRPLALDPSAVAAAAAGMDGPVAVVVPASADPAAYARALGPDAVLVGGRVR